MPLNWYHRICIAIASIMWTFMHKNHLKCYIYIHRYLGVAISQKSIISRIAWVIKKDDKCEKDLESNFCIQWSSSPTWGYLKTGNHIVLMMLELRVWTRQVELIELCLFLDLNSFYRRSKLIKTVINRGALINREVSKEMIELRSKA